MHPLFSCRLLSVLCACAAPLATGARLHAHNNDPALYPAMIQAFTEELAKAPETDLFIQRGELYLHCREWAKAEADFGAAAKRDPQRLIIGLQRARALFHLGRSAEAQPLVDYYLEQKPSQADAWILRGEIMAALGKPNRAHADYVEGFRRAPDADAEQTLHWARLLAALASGEADTVLSILDHALTRLGPTATLIEYAIDLEVAGGHYDRALARIARALETGRWQGPLLARQGDVLLKAGRRTDAVVSYRAALEVIDTLPERNRTIPDVQKLARDAQDAIARLSSK